MGRKHEFVSSVIQVLAHNRDGSYRTQNDRRNSLLRSLKELYDKGYQLNHVQYIRRRHIYALVKGWQSQDISAGAMKNRLSHFRWLMHKLNKMDVIPSNDALGIPRRIYVTNIDKSRDLTQADLSAIDDQLMQLSLQGQKLFGLRMEESLKLQPYVADQGEFLYLKSSWAKGGRERLVPILTVEQRGWLEECKNAVKSKKHSLIPPDVSYKTYRKRFEKRCERAGINKRHGLRHQYAQRRYAAMTGFECVVKGGLTKREMTPEQRQLDLTARWRVSQDLGHSRISNITSQYLGAK